MNLQCDSGDLPLSSMTPSPGRVSACFGKEKGADEVREKLRGTENMQILIKGCED